MVAGVAQEINTPLAYVKNSLGTVADKLRHSAETLANCEKAAGVCCRPATTRRALAAIRHRVGTAQPVKQQGVVGELSNLVKDGLYGTGQMAEIVAI